MYFVKFFTNGEVTATRFAQFFCPLCNKKHSIETSRRDFDTSPRPCPDCKATDSNDLRRHLTQKRDELTKQIQKLQQELDSINVELLTTDPNTKEKEPCPVKS
jgi:DNA repair exonuclease SbcCD ATPase subunit